MFKKFVLILLGGGALLIGGVVVFVWTTLSVGHLNFMATKSELYQIVTLAEKLDLKPGQSAQVILDKGVLVPTKFMGTEVWRDTKKRLFISISRGGGTWGGKDTSTRQIPRLSRFRSMAFP